MKDLFSSICLVSLVPSIVFAIYLVCMPMIKNHTSATWKLSILKSILILFILPVYAMITSLSSSLGTYFHVVSPEAYTEMTSTIGVQRVTQWSTEANAIAEKANTATLDLLGIVATVWMVGIAVIVLSQVVCYLGFIKKAKLGIPAYEIESMLSEEKEKLAITQDLPIFYDKFAATPMLIGLAKPKILLPYQGVKEHHLAYILLHELIHLKRKDLWWKLVLQGICTLHWLNPMVYLLRIEFEKQLEYSCDELVAKSLSFEERKDYAFSILQSVHIANKQNYALIGIGFSSSKEKLERRITNMLHCKNTKKFPKILSTTFVVLLIATIAIPAFSEGKTVIDHGVPIPPVSTDLLGQASTLDTILIDTLETEKPTLDTTLMDTLETEKPTLDTTLMDTLETATPILGVITSTFGQYTHPVTGEVNVHTGVDIRGNQGDPINSFASGVVDAVGYDHTTGNYLSIDHGNGIKSFYCHCHQIDVIVGQEVTVAAQVAQVGTTGASTGPHLHFELKLDETNLNPLDYIDSLAN